MGVEVKMITGDHVTIAVETARVLGLGTRIQGPQGLPTLQEGGAVPDTRHTVAPGPEDWWSLDLTYRRPLRGGWIEASVGADHRDRQWNDTTAVLPRAAVSWRHEFQ